MATWTNVPNSSIETDKPVRAVDIRALRDNPIAIAGGASGAPRIDGSTGPAVNTGGIFNGAVTNPKLGNSSVSAAKLVSSERMTTANVLGQTAGATLNVVGSYRNAFYMLTSSLSPGGTVAGGNLEQGTNTATSFPDRGSGSSLSGTWRYMGQTSIARNSSITIGPTGLFLRIS